MTHLTEFSVLMSVYSKENPLHLDASIASIWNSQQLRPSHIVLVKDGQLTAELDLIIVKWKSSLLDRLTVIELKYNVGLASALNEGLMHCEHDLVARMDSDDIALPNRFYEQVQFMKENPSVSVCSSQILEYDISMSNELGKRVVPLTNGDIKLFCKTRNPISHPAAIFRKQSVLDVGGYPVFKNSQDWALWSKLIVGGYEFANLPSYLLKMRTDKALLNRRGLKYFLNEFKIFSFQRKLGLYGWRIFILNTVTKFILRASPNVVKTFLYKKFR